LPRRGPRHLGDSLFNPIRDILPSSDSQGNRPHKRFRRHTCLFEVPPGPERPARLPAHERARAPTVRACAARHRGHGGAGGGEPRHPLEEDYH